MDSTELELQRDRILEIVQQVSLARPQFQEGLEKIARALLIKENPNALGHFIRVVRTVLRFKTSNALVFLQSELARISAERMQQEYGGENQSQQSSAFALFFGAAMAVAGFVTLINFLHDKTGLF